MTRTIFLSSVIIEIDEQTQQTCPLAVSFFRDKATALAEKKVQEFGGVVLVQEIEFLE